MILEFFNLPQKPSIRLLKKLSNLRFRNEKGDWPSSPVIRGPDTPVRLLGYSLGRTSSLLGYWHYALHDGARRELRLSQLENDTRCVIPVEWVDFGSMRKTYAAFDAPHRISMKSGEEMLIAGASQQTTPNSPQFFAFVTVDPKSVGLPEGPAIPLVIPQRRFHEYLESTVQNPYLPNAEDFEGILMRPIVDLRPEAGR